MNTIRLDAALLCLLIASLSGASVSASSAQEKPLDEVLVQAQEQIEMLGEMVRLEDRFFARYNELNPNDDFDMHCAMEARVGTQLKRRYCRAVYMNKALQLEGSDHAEALKKMQSGQPWVPPLPPIMEIEARRKDYQKNMREIVSRNPELVDLLRERYELGKRYEAAYLKNSGRKPAAEGNDAGSVPLLP